MRVCIDYDIEKEEYTEKLTDIARKLGFAAAATCWFFRSDGNIFPDPILAALVSVVIYFICDVMQFFLGAIMLRLWTRHMEKLAWATSATIDGDYDKPAWLDYPRFCMWCMKVLFLLMSFAFIGYHLVMLGLP
ncbi:hypothetical protein DSCO28_07780 [Desulfosarcina ovata subsp. sediminis]|uniref:Uncharacterized protein n=1 Tax=Desulfosarcina ovata subsp. sediminis TaxID=885957 RepID=A0A5K7ZDX4_9BACT|nr:hypothetical protein [Desulfosarcina ovata]BBO80212.1 hypothetical protein DSCO28_07780 [Desulfosarcina ovata subsp. sediminis]